MQWDLFNGAKGANHVIGVQYLDGKWQYHCDIVHSAYCGLPAQSAIKKLGRTGNVNNTFLKGIFNAVSFLCIEEGDPQASPSPWFQKIWDLVENETQDNSAAVPENWICTRQVRFADTFRPHERSWKADAYIVISEYQEWKLIKWNEFDCRYALWIPNTRIKTIEYQTFLFQ